MRKFFKKLKICYSIFELLGDSEVTKQRLAEIQCVILGHDWGSEFDPAKPIDRKVVERTFCKVCGERYHIHRFKR